MNYKCSTMLMFLVGVPSVFGAGVVEITRVRDDGYNFVRNASGEGAVLTIAKGPDAASIWFRETGITSLESVIGQPFAMSYLTVSADGHIGGRTSGEDQRQPFLWSEDSGLRRLGLPRDATRGDVKGISGDGSVLAIQASQPAGSLVHRWTHELGFERLDLPAGFASSRSQGISTDGLTIVGDVRREDGDSEAAVWKGLGEAELLGMLPGFSSSRAWDISADGSVVVGKSSKDCLCSQFAKAFLWTAIDGMIDLAPNDQQRGSEALSVSDDGAVVLGTTFGRGGGEQQSFIWDAFNGMRDLETVLHDEYGVDVPADLIGLHEPFDISANGQVIVGETQLDPVGINFNHKNTWAVFLDRPLVANTGITGDFNGTAELDSNDLDLLSAELQANHNVKLFDVNADEMVDFADRQFWVEELAQTFLGDANLDQEVNFADFLALSAGFGKEGGWAEGDFDGDGQTKFEDFLMLSENFGKVTTDGVVASSVPEPSSCWPMSVVVFALLSRRRRSFASERTARFGARAACQPSVYPH